MNAEEKAFDDIQKACKVLGWAIAFPDPVDEDAEVQMLIIGEPARINEFLQTEDEE